ncbi:hypothetical protein PR048_009196 [Dryococelus australis]|uniref:Uncharacterized protein n=1 Tax=Dryococelus australis TaxID=614101 RepID=A0ABQ9HZ91_9NEOP|nr:hypothetical protein PR048_009196 [Dryococelus australis]
MRMIPDQRKSVSSSREHHLSSATVQLTMPVAGESAHAQRQLELLCVSTIPAFQAADAGAGQAAYVDKRYTAIAGKYTPVTLTCHFSQLLSNLP